MKILILCEGDAETWDSWSGCSRSVMEHLRAEGHEVTPGDVDLYGLRKYITLLVTFALNRRRWWVRYHLGSTGFKARSRRAQHFVKKHGRDVDVILQFGATFRVRPPRDLPYVLYCDSNIALARDGAASGQSEAISLTQSEVEEVRAREAGVYERAARIFTFSDRLRDSFIERFGIPSERVETIFAGPNFRFGVSPTVRERGIRADPVVLFIGRAFHRKGGDVLLRAFRRVRQIVPDARLLIIGPDRLPEDADADVPGVEMLGFLDKETDSGHQALHEAYSRATVFCLPTRFEPFGVVFLEAMHYELPCVGPRSWAVPEIIDHGRTGLLVSPDDVDALSDALIELLQDRRAAQAMGQLGKRRLANHFTWSKVAQRMTHSLDELLTGHSTVITHDNPIIDDQRAS